MGSSLWTTVANMVVVMGVAVCSLLYSWSTYIDFECEGLFLCCVSFRNLIETAAKRRGVS